MLKPLILLQRQFVFVWIYFCKNSLVGLKFELAKLIWTSNKENFKILGVLPSDCLYEKFIIIRIMKNYELWVEKEKI